MTIKIKDVIDIHQLNHASLLMVTGGIRLLTDPWYEGGVFDQGWKLRWHNPDALDLACTATHLWISHPHSDHLHYPTLKHIAEKNPDIIVLANHAYNYDIRPQLNSLGFRSVISLPEEKMVPLSEECTVQRIGSGSIDSLLIIRTGGMTILNLNDCVMQKGALKKLSTKIGTIDLLFSNFNHAGKLLHFPQKTPEDVRLSLTKNYQGSIDILKPRYAVPFASFHQYLSPFSLYQNDSLLEPLNLQLAADSSRIISLYPGQHLQMILAGADKHFSITGSPAATDNDSTIPILDEREDMDGKLQQAIEKFEQRLRYHFGWWRWVLPRLSIKISDMNKVISMHHGRIQETHDEPDIEAHAEKLINWFNQPSGTDAFVVGAHFAILRPCVGRIKLLFALLLLAEAKVSPHYCFSPALWKFILARRHEILAALLSGRVSSSYQ